MSVLLSKWNKQQIHNMASNPNFDPTMPEHKSNRRWLQIDAFALESRQPGDPLIQVVHKTHNTQPTQAEIDFITANY
jgi:hypothetical protein